VLDLSGPYRAAYNAAIPHTAQVADPFHVVRLANNRLDEVRRRTQNQTLGHRSRKDNPRYRIHKLLTCPRTPQPRSRGTPPRPPQSRRPTEKSAWPDTPKKPSTTSTRPETPTSPTKYTRQLTADLQDQPPEVNQPGRAVARWYTQIAARRPLPGIEQTHRSSQQSHPNASNESGSGTTTSPTTEYGHCSTQANPTGTYLPSVTPP